jgi:hypothetical protein
MFVQFIRWSQSIEIMGFLSASGKSQRRRLPIDLDGSRFIGGSALD